MKFITKLDFTADLDRMKGDLEYLLSQRPWPGEDFVKKSGGNQLGITHRPNASDVFLDADGSLFNKQTGEQLATEADFSIWNPLTPQYTRNILEQLAEHCNTSFGRIRYMRLMPKQGLSIHADMEERYHFVLETNPYALFGEYTGEEEMPAKCFHIPANGHFYKVDTTRQHFVYNGGWEPRIHLVICSANKS